MIPQSRSKMLSVGTVLLLIALVAVACSSDPEVVVQTVIVEKVSTVIVEKEIQVPGAERTVIVEKIVTPTPAIALPTAVPEKINIPNPGSSGGTLVMIPRVIPPGVGINSSQAPEEQNYWGVSEGLFRVVGDSS